MSPLVALIALALARALVGGPFAVAAFGVGLVFGVAEEFLGIEELILLVLGLAVEVAADEAALLREVAFDRVCLVRLPASTPADPVEAFRAVILAVGTVKHSRERGCYSLKIAAGQ